MSRTLIFMSLVLSGCPFPEDDTGDSGGTNDTGSTPTVPEAFGTCAATDGHAYEITTGDSTPTESPIRIEGHTLTVDVAYGGGCETHLWEICWPDQSFAESNPVQAFLELWHGGVPDMCDAYIFETVTFDLQPLKDAWQMAYGADGGTILVHVNGEEAVEYTFDG